MATTVTAATMTVTITESITLNGSDQGSTNTFTVANVNEVFKRIVTCEDDTDVTVATFRSSTSTSDGAVDVENVVYMRVTNLDDANPVNLSLQIDVGEDNSAADQSCTILLQAGKSFVMGTPSDGLAVDDDAATIVTSLYNLESLLVDPLSEAVDVEVFIACT
jgi:hypothetical protein|tara:strand:+ start:109 stop:597 length:489 start_codon:yes stop_codon:yes gene_type:complete